MADSNEYTTTIGPDAVFKGELEFAKGVRLLGKFEGQINSEGELEVAEGAQLKGDVKAASVRIDGKVKGNMQVSSRVQLSASARLEGDLQTTRLEVAEGAVLIGRCMVGVNGDAKKAAEVKSAVKGTGGIAIGKARAGEPAVVGAKK